MDWQAVSWFNRLSRWLNITVTYTLYCFSHFRYVFHFGGGGTGLLGVRRLDDSASCVSSQRATSLVFQINLILIVLASFSCMFTLATLIEISTYVAHVDDLDEALTLHPHPLGKLEKRMIDDILTHRDRPNKWHRLAAMQPVNKFASRCQCIKRKIKCYRWEEAQRVSTNRKLRIISDRKER